MTASSLIPVPVAFLYLDDQACDRCRDSGSVLETAAKVVAPALAAIGVVAEIRRHHVLSAAEAEALGFVASPTIRIAGRDIQPDAALSPCRECGDLCGCVGGVDCRVWRWQGTVQTTVPLGLVASAMLAAGLDAAGLAVKAVGDGVTRASDGGAGVARFLERHAANNGAATPAVGPEAGDTAGMAAATGGRDTDCGCAPTCCGGRPA